MKNTFKVLGIIALVAIIGFSMFSCGDKNDSGGGDAKKITVTGITGNYSMAMISLISEDSDSGIGGMGEISGGSVTFGLMNEDETAYTGSGSFYVMLIVGNENDEDGAFYVYTNSVSNVDLSTEQKAMENMKKVTLTSAVTSIAFNLFQTAPAWMN
jgi:hypothetical protein